MNAQSKVEASTLSADLVAAYAEIGGAAKDKVNPAFKSKYADIASVIDAVKPVLARHNLAFYQRSQPSEDGVLVQTMLRHSGGEEVDLGTLYVPANKKDPQGFGSALTYARRYALMTAFGVPAEDDDGNAAVASAPKAGSVKINDEQLGVLQGYASGGVIDAARFCAFFQIGSLKDLPAARYDEALRMAQAKAAKAKEVEPVQ
jgi:hypothetical protein